MLNRIKKTHLYWSHNINKESLFALILVCISIYSLHTLIEEMKKQIISRMANFCHSHIMTINSLGKTYFHKRAK